MRGTPDCTLVQTDFGIYLADDVLHVQIFFLSNCRDVTATQSAITEMFQWLNSADEVDDVVQRARSRHRILEIVAQERPKKDESRRVPRSGSGRSQRG
jgi:hypothetical protein